MQQEDALDGEATTAYTVLKQPILLGSLALTVLPFLLPIYAKQLGASAVSIGGLFAVAQLMLVLLRPGIGWAIDRLGRKGFSLPVSSASRVPWDCLPLPTTS